MIGVSYNGSIAVSKTVNVGSNPTTPAIYISGGCGEVVNAPDCGSGIRGFDSHQSPHLELIGLVLKRLVVALLSNLFCFNMDGLGRSTFYISLK